MTPTRGIVITFVAAVLYLSGGRTYEWVPREAPLVNARVTATETHDPWAVTPSLPEYRPTPIVLRVADPTRVQIPAIGVDAPLVRLGLQSDGAMEVPADYDTPGWYTGAPRPGENGPAVIAGHVDSKTGPAVFFHLDVLQPGDEVHIPRADGRRSTFVVTRVSRFDKKTFPTVDVFGPTSAPELRLLTCGGDFDFLHHTYRANVVVFARLR